MELDPWLIFHEVSPGVCESEHFPDDKDSPITARFVIRSSRPGISSSGFPGIIEEVTMLFPDGTESREWRRFVRNGKEPYGFYYIGRK